MFFFVFLSEKSRSILNQLGSLGYQMVSGTCVKVENNQTSLRLVWLVLRTHFEVFNAFTKDSTISPYSFGPFGAVQKNLIVVAVALPRIR